MKGWTRRPFSGAIHGAAPLGAARFSERHLEAKLVVVEGETKARHFELHLPAVIGRSRTTDVVLGHPLVSRRHCEVFEADGLLMLRDLGSLNGTFVGQTRLAEEPSLIRPGDQFTVGPITFRAEYEPRANHAADAPWDAARQTLDAPLTDLDEHD
jgi:predicted component of type VI protein secretion system